MADHFCTLPIHKLYGFDTLGGSRVQGFFLSQITQTFTDFLRFEFGWYYGVLRIKFNKEIF